MVMRSRAVPAGTLDFEDIYEEDPETGARTVVEIHILFHDNDVTPGYEDDMSAAFTIEAQRWAEAESPSLSAAASATPPTIRVRRVPDLPAGLSVFIQDDLDFVNVLFLEAGITEGAALAYQEFLEARATSWRRNDGD